MGRNGKVRIVSQERAMRMEKLSERVRLSSDLLCKQVIIKLIGRKTVVVENCKGIISYSDEKICLSTMEGKIECRGSGLCVEWFSDVELCVRGRIVGFEFGE